MSPATLLISSESKQRQSLQKDWTSAFATLSSLYGFDGKAPSIAFTPQKPSKLRSSSYVPPRSKNYNAPTDPQKTQSLEGYELGFGQLASSYGFGGPTISQPKTTKYSWSIFAFI
ncbi:hypothetical protein BYT27DRAFT_7206080 [Phlegmacium glaucopus]|nr:hypothetical protein BYT27DRAFT_7201187 [Phlegmacium glaucopus]KAF8814505.1 hypothetical protein BYT27DRAFT_7206080 [Phlegmacium glaucopus]